LVQLLFMRQVMLREALSFSRGALLAVQTALPPEVSRQRFTALGAIEDALNRSAGPIPLSDQIKAALTQGEEICSTDANLGNGVTYCKGQDLARLLTFEAKTEVAPTGPAIAPEDKDR